MRHLSSFDRGCIKTDIKARGNFSTIQEKLDHEASGPRIASPEDRSILVHHEQKSALKVMLASTFDPKLITVERSFVAEPKRDGIRAVCLIEKGQARFVTRNGHSLVALSSLAAEAIALASRALSGLRLPSAYADPAGLSILLDGEIVAGDFTQTVRAVRQTRCDAQNAVFHVFDIVPLGLFRANRTVDIPLWERRELLEDLFDDRGVNQRISLVEQRRVANAGDCDAVCTEWQAQGFEGAMIKDLNAPYMSARSQAWLKMKREETDDLEVKDVFEGAGKFAGMLGGVICSRSGKLLRVSSGFSDAQRRSSWRDRKTLTGRVVEVAYQEVTRNLALRHPRFIRFRDDRSAADLA